MDIKSKSTNEMNVETKFIFTRKGILFSCTLAVIGLLVIVVTGHSTPYFWPGLIAGLAMGPITASLIWPLQNHEKPTHKDLMRILWIFIPLALCFTAENLYGEKSSILAFGISFQLASVIILGRWVKRRRLGGLHSIVYSPPRSGMGIGVRNVQQKFSKSSEKTSK